MDDAVRGCDAWWVVVHVLNHDLQRYDRRATRLAAIDANDGRREGRLGLSIEALTCVEGHLEAGTGVELRE